MEKVPTKMKVIQEVKYPIPSIGVCDLCKETDKPLNRVYHHYDGTCECHSPNHFDIWDVCNSCEVPSKLDQEIVVDCRFKSLEELRKS